MLFTKYKVLLTILLSFYFYESNAQQKFTISGHVKDSKNGEDVIGAAVIAKEVNISAVSNIYGFYSLTLPQGKYTVTINSLGYNAITQEIDLSKNILLDVNLETKSEELKEVEIVSEKSDVNVKSIEMSVAKLDIKTIQKIPAFLGEVDIIRAIQLLPGVSTVGEGASGFNVRGGSSDQNLILMDEAPVYNSSHLFGFFSVFNPDAVKDVKLYKGGIPAQYGGRLSSVLDVRLKDGNNKTYHAEGGLGIIFSRLSIEGPIVKNKSSFLIAGRRSYFDLFFPLSSDKAIKGSKAYFYDLTVKLNTIINDKNRIYLSGYFGRDAFSFGSPAFGFSWGNSNGTFRWNHIYNSRLFSNVNVIYSNYDYQLGVGSDADGFNWKSKIINYTIKPEFTYYYNPKNTITFGGSSTYYNFDAGSLIFYSDGEKREIGSNPKYTNENALYIANEQKVSGRFSLQYGLRFSNFNFIGKGTAYTYRDTTPNIRKEVMDTLKYGNWDVIKSYNNLEPRFSVKFDVSDKSSLKASYNRTTQNLHLISNTTASTPLDVWTPSTNNLRPELADQIALGYFRNFRDDDMYETSVETYYKTFQNQVDYIDGANLLLNELLEGELLSGKGRAYGLEVFLKKNKGRFTGWISYTLARTERKIVGINNDAWYANRFDKTHNLSVVGMLDLTKRIEIGATFVFASGTPGTFPTNRLEWQGYVIPHNVDGARNNTRIPAYHRLDLAVTFHLTKNKTRNFKHDLVVSAYNVYAHRNPFSIYFQGNPDNPTQTQAIKFSVVGTVIPSVMYNFKF
jgi:uncharacterized protein YsxB (DUF464 family)